MFTGYNRSHLEMASLSLSQNHASETVGDCTFVHLRLMGMFTGYNRSHLEMASLSLSQNHASETVGDYTCFSLEINGHVHRLQ